MAQLMSILKKFWWVILIIVIVILVIVFWPKISSSVGSSSSLDPSVYQNANETYAGYTQGTVGMTAEQLADLAILNQQNAAHDLQVKNAKIAIARETAFNTANSKATNRLTSDIQRWFSNGDSNKKVHDWLTNNYAYDKPYGQANNVPLWWADYKTAAKESMSDWKDAYITSPSLVALNLATKEFNTWPSGFSSASLTTLY